MQDSAVLSTTARASGLHNGRGRSVTDTALAAAEERACEASSLSLQMAVRVVVAVEEHRPVGGLARQAQKASRTSLRCLQTWEGEGWQKSEHWRSFLAPHTSGPRDVPRCGALILLQKDAALQGGSSRNRC